MERPRSPAGNANWAHFTYCSSAQQARGSGHTVQINSMAVGEDPIAGEAGPGLDERMSASSANRRPNYDPDGDDEDQLPAWEDLPGEVLPGHARYRAGRYPSPWARVIRLDVGGPPEDWRDRRD